MGEFIAIDEANFDHYCRQLESMLQRKLTDAERQQLRFTVPLVGPPVVVERRQESSAGGTDTRQEDTSKAAD